MGEMSFRGAGLLQIIVRTNKKRREEKLQVCSHKLCSCNKVLKETV